MTNATPPRTILAYYKSLTDDELRSYRNAWQAHVLETVKLTKAQRSIFDAVADSITLSGEHKGECRLSNAEIAKKAGVEGKRVGERVRQHLRPLLDGESLVVVEAGRGRGKTRIMTMGSASAKTPTKAPAKLVHWAPAKNKQHNLNGLLHWIDTHPQNLKRRPVEPGEWKTFPDPEPNPFQKRK